MFEQSVLATPQTRSPALFLVATATELFLLAAAILIPLFLIAPPGAPKAPFGVLNYRPPHVEIVALERVESPRNARAALPRLTDLRIVAPTRVPTSIMTSVDAASAPDLDPGLSNMPAGPGPIGILDGHGVNPPPPPIAKTPAPVRQSEAIRVSKGVQEAKLITKVLPQYPRLALQTRQFGTVHLVATIGRDGHVKAIQLLGGPVFLVPAAMEAIRQWVYKPTLLNGEPVEVIAPIDINFVLNQ